MSDGMGIQGIGALKGIETSMMKPLAVAEPAGTSFKDVLFAKIDQVNGLQQEAEAAMANYAAGRTQNIEDVMTAVQKADLAFQTLLQIRNKLFDAYQEINQLRI